MRRGRQVTIDENITEKVVCRREIIHSVKGADMEQYVMGIDVGTGTSKGVIIDEQCRIVRMEQVSHTMDNPVPGYFEMDAEEIWWGDVCR